MEFEEGEAERAGEGCLEEGGLVQVPARVRAQVHLLHRVFSILDLLLLLRLKALLELR